MNPIEELVDRLRDRLPGLVAAIDKPASDTASWWADCELDGHTATVEWRPGLGFGVSSTAADAFGEGSDEVYAGVTDTVERVADVLTHRHRTAPPRETVLRQLRQSVKISQEQLAARLNVRQATISKMESRSDMFLSTLRAAIEAMGGELEVRARFPQGTYRIAHLGELTERRRKKRRGRQLDHQSPSETGVRPMVTE